MEIRLACEPEKIQAPLGKSMRIYEVAASTPVQRPPVGRWLPLRRLQPPDRRRIRRPYQTWLRLQPPAVFRLNPFD
mgnify:CR=1 FL=1